MVKATNRALVTTIPNQCWLQNPWGLAAFHCINVLTYWGRVTHIRVGKLTIIGSDNGLSPGRRQAIIWTNAGILLIGSLGTNFSEILIATETFSFKKMHLKMSSAKWRLFGLGLNELKLLSLNIANYSLICQGQGVKFSGTETIIYWDLSQCHGCWCPGSLRRQQPWCWLCSTNRSLYFQWDRISTTYMPPQHCKPIEIYLDFLLLCNTEVAQVIFHFYFKKFST